MPTVERAVDDGDDPITRIMVEKVLLEDGFACAGFAKDEAKASLLGVDFEDVEVALLVL